MTTLIEIFTHLAEKYREWVLPTGTIISHPPIPEDSEFRLLVGNEGAAELEGALRIFSVNKWDVRREALSTVKLVDCKWAMEHVFKEKNTLSSRLNQEYTAQKSYYSGCLIAAFPPKKQEPLFL